MLRTLSVSPPRPRRRNDRGFATTEILVMLVVTSLMVPSLVWLLSDTVDLSVTQPTSDPATVAAAELSGFGESIAPTVLCDGDQTINELEYCLTTKPLRGVFLVDPRGYRGLITAPDSPREEALCLITAEIENGEKRRRQLQCLHLGGDPDDRDPNTGVDPGGGSLAFITYPAADTDDTGYFLPYFQNTSEGSSAAVYNDVETWCFSVEFSDATTVTCDAETLADLKYADYGFYNERAENPRENTSTPSRFGDGDRDPGPLRTRVVPLLKAESTVVSTLPWADGSDALLVERIEIFACIAPDRQIRERDARLYGSERELWLAGNAPERHCDWQSSVLPLSQALEGRTSAVDAVAAKAASLADALFEAILDPSDANRTTITDTAQSWAQGEELATTTEVDWPEDATDLKPNYYWVQPITIDKFNVRGDGVPLVKRQTPGGANVAPSTSWSTDPHPKESADPPITAVRMLVTGSDNPDADWVCALVVANIWGVVPLGNTGSRVDFESDGHYFASDEVDVNHLKSMRGAWYQSSSGKVNGAPKRACDPVSQASQNLHTLCSLDGTVGTDNGSDTDRATAQPSIFDTSGVLSDTSRWASCLALNGSGQWQVNADHILTRSP